MGVSTGAGSNRRRGFVFLSGLAALHVLCVTQEAWGEPEAPGVYESEWPRDGASGVPTDSQVWLTGVGYGSEVAIDATLEGPEGPVDVEIEVLPNRGVRFNLIAVLKPLTTLSPQSLYTVKASVAGGGFSSESRLFSFTTGAGPLTDPAPRITDTRYFKVTGYYEDEFTGRDAWDASHVVFPTLPASRYPAFFTLQYSGPQGTGSAELDGTTHGIGFPRIMVHTLGVGGPECVNLSVTDIVGRTTTSEPMCDPMCVAGVIWSLPNNPDVWEVDETACDPPDPAPDLEPSPQPPAPSDGEPQAEAPKSVGNCQSAPGVPAQGPLVAIVLVAALVRSLKRQPFDY